ncbi:MAG: hypothetical protein ABR589_05790 [Chthoniobacterales bacterium]
MSRWIGTFLVATIAIVSVVGQDELPRPEESEPLPIEPPILIQSRDSDGLPIVPAAPQSADLAKLEADLVKAKKSAASGDRLFKAGIIAKVESEERVLKVVRLEAKIAEARLEAAKSTVEEENADPSAAETVAEAAQAAQRAIEERRRAELEAAFRNLQRQQKLLALGSGRRADVNRAEKKLAELQGAGN